MHTQTHTYMHTRDPPTLLQRPGAGDNGENDSSDPADTVPAEIDESTRKMLEKMMRGDAPPNADQ